MATLQETVTVTGASPIVDSSTTQVGTNFTKELLTEIPNARDIWAAMAQAPGIQMTSYDVGGSRTGTQTGFLTYGFGDQNQTKLEGIDTTEGTGANAGYFDFGSFEEFQVGGAGSGADSFGGGTNMSITVKSGGDRFTGNWYSDWQGDATISDNVPDAFRVANQRTRTASSPARALTRGNPIDRQYDINFNVGGPLWKQKAWFFYSYRLNDQYKYTLGIDDAGAFEAVQQLHLQGHLPAQSQQPGDRLPEQAQQAAGAARPRLRWCRSRRPATRPRATTRGSASGPACSATACSSTCIGGNWYNFFPLDPTDQHGFATNVVPGRIDTATNQRTGYHDAYQDQKRYKPQVYVDDVVLQGRLEGQPRLQVRLRLEARSPPCSAAPQPGNIFYRDLNGAVNELELYNSPNTSQNDVVYNAASSATRGSSPTA